MKKKLGKNVLGFVIALVLLFGSGLVGMFTGVFEDFEDSMSTVRFDVQTILEAIIAFSFMFALKSIVNIVFSQIRVTKSRSKTLTTIIASVIKYTIFLIGFCWILSIVGVNVSTIFASIGVVALIVGFGAESLVADVVTGIFVLFENQFNVGDIIEIDGFRGTVENISIRTISIRDPGGNVKIINNSDLKNIINRSDRGSVSVAEVGVAYETDLEELEKRIPSMLKEIKEKYPEIFIGGVDYLGVEELAASSVVLKFKADVNESDVFTGKRLLNRELKVIFDRENVVISFPQVDIHMK